MRTFKILSDCIMARNDDGSTLKVERSGNEHIYSDLVEALLRNDWDLFDEILWARDVEPEVDEVQLEGLHFDDVGDIIVYVRDILADEIITPEMLGLIAKPEVGEHDLSQWSGSPIYFDSEEAAREQADRWPMFWEFHDFGVSTPLPVKYRYAVVPKLSLAPTAPVGYDWVCLKRS